MTREEMRVLATAAVATWTPVSQETFDRLYVLFAPMRDKLVEIQRLKAQQRIEAA